MTTAEATRPRLSDPLRRAHARLRCEVETAVCQRPHWSNRRLASDLGVSRGAVATARRRLIDAGTIEPTARVGCDGKRYPAEGKRGQAARARIRLARLSRQLGRIANEISADGFAEGYALADVLDRRLFQAAVISLAARANQLRKAADFHDQNGG